MDFEISKINGKKYLLIVICHLILKGKYVCHFIFCGYSYLQFLFQFWIILNGNGLIMNQIIHHIIKFLEKLYLDLVVIK